MGRLELSQEPGEGVGGPEDARVLEDQRDGRAARRTLGAAREGQERRQERDGAQARRAPIARPRLQVFT
jgi:hypothetical protein